MCLMEERTMSLLENWRNKAYGEKDQAKSNQLWNAYFVKEKAIYEKLLENPEAVEEGTVKELAEKYDMSLEFMVGFLDGINDSLKTPNPIETMEEDTKVSLPIDTEKLYKNMVDCDAKWLYSLEQWDKIYDKEKQKELFLEQKKSNTIKRSGKKVMPNDPCPCGSGKKHKKCCGRNA